MANSNESFLESRDAFEYGDVDVDDELLCSICKLPFVVPVESKGCGHTFCQSCINHWLESDDTCPICRADVEHQDNFVPVQSKIVLNQLDRIPVKCNRCGETGIRAHRAHLSKCPKQIISCSSAADLKCPWRGTRDKAQEHAETCIYQQLRPILDQHRVEVETLKKQQADQKRLLKLVINNGYPMHASCVMPNCYYLNQRVISDRSAFICTLCASPLSNYVGMALHSCYGGCVCRSCSRKHDLVDETITRPSETMTKPYFYPSIRPLFLNQS